MIGVPGIIALIYAIPQQLLINIVDVVVLTGMVANNRCLKSEFVISNIYVVRVLFITFMLLSVTFMSCRKGG